MKSISGNDATGASIDLTNKVTLDSKARLETIGVHDTFDAKMTVPDSKTLDRIAETIWRIVEMKSR